jgi:two-component system response regulator DevR
MGTDQVREGRQQEQVSGDRQPIRVVVIDPHPIVREGVRSVLANAPDLRLVGEAATAPSAEGIVSDVRPDVVLLELWLARTSTIGLSICRRLTRRGGLSVLVFTDSIDESTAAQAIRSGAQGFIAKNVSPSELVNAVRAAARGDYPLDLGSARKVVRRGPMQPQLSAREQTVIRLVADGRSNREIGHELKVAETTVRFHMRNAMHKLGATRRSSAVYVASKAGLI